MTALRPGAAPAGEPEPATAGVEDGALRRQRRRTGETLAVWLLRASALASVLITAGIVAVLSTDAIGFFRTVPLARPVNVAWGDRSDSRATSGPSLATPQAHWAAGRPIEPRLDRGAP